jgi:transcriptional regulator of acetoin/glycerol metabolism
MFVAESHPMEKSDSMTELDKTPLQPGLRDSEGELAPDSLMGVRVLCSPDASQTGRIVAIHDLLCLGRSPGRRVNLVVSDPMLSREHVSIERQGSHYVITDHESTNGTLVDGKAFTQKTLPPGSVIRAGDTLLLFSTLPSDPPTDDDAFVGTSLASCRLRRSIAAVASRALPVLIVGETGTGKELVANGIHASSGRKGAFVAVNCGAIPAALTESLFFGHQRGAFTGAMRDEGGYFLAAQGGTLFLDEIGELPLELQPKLLRVLDTHQFQSVGSQQLQKTDARVIAATNVNLSAKVEAGTFRRDLFARLRGFMVHTTPLRERADDILPLFDHFAQQTCPGVIRSVEFSEALLRYRWPLNAREVRSVAEQSTLQGGSSLLAKHLPEDIVRDLASHDAVHEPTHDELFALLRRHRGNISAVAGHFSKDRKQVYRWMEKHGLSLDSFR